MAELGIDLLVAGIAFAGFLLVHGYFWNKVGAQRAGIFFLVMLWVGCVYLTVAVVGKWGPEIRLLTVVCVDALLLTLYLHLYLGMLRSVSLRILGELCRHGGAMERDALAEVYSPEAVLEHRLAWLVDRGWLEVEGERLRITAGGRRVLAFRRPFVALLVKGPTG